MNIKAKPSPQIRSSKSIEILDKSIWIKYLAGYKHYGEDIR